MFQAEAGTGNTVNVIIAHTTRLIAFIGYSNGRLCDMPGQIHPIKDKQILAGEETRRAGV
jgi:hypothetical protein